MVKSHPCVLGAMCNWPAICNGWQIMRWDLEEDLARIVGDPLATR